MIVSKVSTKKVFVFCIFCKQIFVPLCQTEIIGIPLTQINLCWFLTLFAKKNVLTVGLWIYWSFYLTQFCICKSVVVVFLIFKKIVQMKINDFATVCVIFRYLVTPVTILMLYDFRSTYLWPQTTTILSRLAPRRKPRNPAVLFGYDHGFYVPAWHWLF